MIRRLAPVLLVALALAGCGACGPLAGPEAEVAGTLHSMQSSGARIALPGREELALTRLRFDRLLVKPEAGRFVAVATVDAEGTYGGRTKVSYLGVERIPFARANGHLAPSGPTLPALAEIAELLLRRADALAHGDAEALEQLVASDWTDARLSREQMLALLRQRGAQPGYRADAWLVRAEREYAEVVEEYAISEGATSSRGRSRWTLRREGGQLRFASGLM